VRLASAALAGLTQDTMIVNATKDTSVLSMWILDPKPFAARLAG
jgi:hypothetical protein